jgi:hypothetical protein
MSRFNNISYNQDHKELTVGTGCVFDEIYKFARAGKYIGLDSGYGRPMGLWLGFEVGMGLVTDGHTLAKPIPTAKGKHHIIRHVSNTPGMFIFLNINSFLY